MPDRSRTASAGFGSIARIRPLISGFGGDVIAGSLVAASGVAGYLGHPLIIVGQLVMGLAIAIRRRMPVVGAVLVAAAFVEEAVVSAHPPFDQVVLIAVPVLAYAVAAYRSRLIGVLGLVILVVGVCVEVAVAHDGQYSFNIALVLVGWIPGAFMAGRRFEIHRLEDDVDRLEAEREQQMLVAAGRERARVVRDLHSAVADGVATMLADLAAADDAFGRSPDVARTALDSVQKTGQGTMIELHRLLGLLRRADASDLG
jgi:signal transduction histidine kinase